MLGKAFLPECLSSLIIILLFQASSASHNLSCNPSACGRIRNISYPFRLREDPKHCGDSTYELVCENNTASLNLNSYWYHVQAIHYNNFTIHLVDPALKKDICSLPQRSLFEYHFTTNYPYSIYIRRHPYSILSRQLENLTTTLTFVSCPYPLNSSRFLETAHCDKTVGSSNDSYSSIKRYAYVKVGDLNVSDVRVMCSIDLIVMTSWPFKNISNILFSEIHDSLLYGFDLSWFSVEIVDCKIQNSCSCYTDGLGICGSYLFTGKLFLLISMIIEGIRVCLAYLAYFIASRIIAIFFLFGLLIYKLRRRHLSVFGAIEEFLGSQNNMVPIRYSYSKIKKMTKGFQEKLGEGGYGSVYKGKLRSGRAVAVKILGKNRENGQDFINEVTTIGRIHHVNVVRLVGYCADRSHRALVYDFMPKGSLDRHLSCQQGGPHSLTWDKKHTIALGVARGIEYLHRGCDVRILHFDIKPHNVLFDEKFVPKVSDFGLARSYPTGHSIVTITAARGTIGYVAPELINRSIGPVSYKADVYSFGMLLMEMVGLKRNLVENTEQSSQSSQYFPDWIYDHLNKGKDIEFGDVDIYENDGRKIARKMTIVALWCIQMNPVDRPSMSKVLEMLESEVNEDLQIPPRPFRQPLHVALAEEQTQEIESTDSIALLCDAASSVDIAIEG